MQTTSAAGGPSRNSYLPRGGDVIGDKYRVDGLVRRDEATVFLQATCLASGERVAIEVLRPEWASHGIVADRFLREGEAAMRIRSEHAVRVLDEGVLENAAPYLVLEPIQGWTLDELVARGGPLPVARAVDYVLQAAEAIAQAHSYGVVHGNLTPSRVLVTRRSNGSWCTKVDFGPRRVSEWLRADEVAASSASDVSRDVCALGAMFRFLVLGSQDSGAVRPTVPRLPGRLLERALHAGRRGGFESTVELARALAPLGTAAAAASCERIQCLLDGRVVELTSATRNPRAPKPCASKADPPPAFVAPASGRVVFLALGMLAVLGALAFSAMYLTVPRGASPASGAAEMQGK